MKLGTWLLSLVSPMLGKILAALGFSVISIIGVEVSINAVRQLVVDNLNTLPSDILNVFLFAGGGKALGMILGAIATRILLWQITSSTKILGVNPG